MNKTIHKKLTENRPLAQTAGNGKPGDLMSLLRHEKQIMDALAADLLQPRPEAVAHLLKLAKAL